VKFLDVDVDQLARALALIALGGLEPQPAQAAHANPGQDPRDRRGCHPQQLGDLRTAKAQPSQRGDRLSAQLVGAIGEVLGRRAAIQQTAL
jgi:hypothetical protein